MDILVMRGGLISTLSKAAPLAASALTLVLCLPGGAAAAEGDTFRPWVFASYGHDDNLFRVANDLEALLVLGTTDKADNYQRYGVGLDIDWHLSRQQFIVKAQASRTRYDRFTTLDYDGDDLSGEWRWQVGNLWSGRLGLARSTTQGSYTELQQLISNTRTLDSRFFEANYWFHSRWRAGLKVRHDTNEYSAASLTSDNSASDTAVLGLYRDGRAIGYSGVEVRAGRSTYPNRPLTPFLDNAFDELGISFVTAWEPSGKSRLNLRLGLQQREGRNLNYSTESLDLDVDGAMALSSKTSLSASVFRRLRSEDFSGANTATTTGMNLGLHWQALPKTSITVTSRFQNVAYEPNNRQDDVMSISIGVDYQPLPGAILSVGLVHDRRDSNQALLDYKSNSAFLSASWKF